MTDESNKSWPPEPSAARGVKSQAAAAEGGVCPTCGRKLLTKLSIMCNWCGAMIKDDAYQQRAAEERAKIDAELKQKVQVEQHETARLGVIGRLKLKKKMGIRIEPPI